MGRKAIKSKIESDLLPEEKDYSIVRLDLMKPPDHPECASKSFETDDLEEVDVTDTNFRSWIAYDAEGNSYDVR